MKSLAETIAHLRNDFSDLESLRLKAISDSKTVTIKGVYGGLFTVMVSAFLIAAFSWNFIYLPLFLLPILITGTRHLASEHKSKFQLNFKDQIIKKIIKAFNPNLKYKPTGMINQVDFEVSKLFKKRPDRMKGEDYLEGMHGDTKFRLSELNPQYKVKTKNGTRWVDIFKGLFLVADFHKYFHSETYILPETFWKKIGLQKQKFQGADLIELEDPDFESKFRVFSTNDTDARYILSPIMMEKITQLYEKYGDDVWISFRGQNIYIALKTSYDFFKHDIKTPITNDSIIKGHLNELEDVMAIIDDLNLNKRIWSKVPVSLTRKENKNG